MPCRTDFLQTDAITPRGKKKKKRPLLCRTVEVESENGNIIFHGKRK